ncbi:Uu.00g136440.m01.CDS01 [Anthostomella pinea]|uniref:Uu.00g136440.m01.CDS01 n=1 Tax=Anthostomella pinea TaxID=933095 RepID=A0AAI8VPY8_9PEZI|nr:Uu.00g136440.m01.CDS01 [Anthostomella pinea]
MSNRHPPSQDVGEGIVVVTEAIFRGFQKEVAAVFTQQWAHIQKLEGRIQDLQHRVDSLEGGKDQAVAAVCVIKGDGAEGVNQH